MQLNVVQSGIERRVVTASYRKTRSGKIHKRVNELYLRNDIPCGMASCHQCQHLEGNVPFPDTDNSTRSKEAPFKHCIIVDAMSILKFIDVLDDDAFSNVIIPQSTWNHVKRINPAIYKKMAQLHADKAQRFFVYLNEFSKDTFVHPGNARVAELLQDEYILRVAEFLEGHWKDIGTRPVIVCSSNELRDRLKQRFENTLTVVDYVRGESIENCGDLAERLGDLSREERRGKALFPEYLTQEELLSGIAKGDLKKGTFKLSPENYLEGYVEFEQGVQWFIQGRIHMNRAVSGDQVVAELLPEEEWTCPEKMIRMRDAEETGAKEGQMEEGAEEMKAELEEKERLEASAPKRQRTEVVPTAKVVGILRRNWRPYCGIIMPSHIPGGRRCLFAPAERLIPRIRIETSHYKELLGKKVLVRIDNWPQDSYYPEGHYIRTIGDEGDRATEDEVILLEHGIPHGDFTPAVLSCLPELPWTPDQSDYRVDLRHLDICSVDPPGCTDIDDALHCVELADGRFEVGVHIADVTHFLRPGTAMDDEATERCTSVYLCGRRIDMLPDLLSGNLCSLRGGEERYAFSVIWVLNKEAEVQGAKFHKSLIKSRAALTYQRAQEMIDGLGEPGDPVLTKSLQNLLALSKHLKGRRKLLGALELASSEIRFDVDRETGQPLKVIDKQHLPTMSMVEEFMLLANIEVAKKILDAFPDCAILRRHPTPNHEAFKPLLEAAEACGLHLNVDTGKQLADSLDQAQIPGKPEINRMLRMLATRCMTQAVYFSAGTVARDEYPHYGLAASVYTHFTSPIRRYADVMVHRLLASVLGADAVHPSMIDRKRLIKLAENMNRRHRAAQYAGRASVLLNTHLMIKNQKQETLPAFVIGLRKNGIQVLIPKYGLESVILFPHSTNSAAPAGNVVDICNQKIRIFQEVKVIVALVEKNQRRKLDVRLVEPEIEGLSVDLGLTAEAEADA